MSFFYIRDVSFVCLYVHHMQLSCGIKSILTYLLTYLQSYTVLVSRDADVAVNTLVQSLVNVNNRNRMVVLGCHNTLY